MKPSSARRRRGRLARHATRAAGFGFAVAVLALFFGLFVFLALMFVLDTFLPLWLSALLTALIIGGLISLLAIMAKQEYEQFSPAPRRMIKSIREDLEWARTQLRSSAK